MIPWSHTQGLQVGGVATGFFVELPVRDDDGVAADDEGEVVIPVGAGFDSLAEGLHGTPTCLRAPSLQGCMGARAQEVGHYR